MCHGRHADEVARACGPSWDPLVVEPLGAIMAIGGPHSGSRWRDVLWTAMYFLLACWDVTVGYGSSWGGVRLA